MPPCDHNHAAARAVVSPLAARFTLLATLWLAPVAQALDSGDIVVTSLEGEVHVTVNGGARDLRAGSVLELPAIVRTGRDGAIELRQGATSVNVGPDTQLEFPALEVPGGPIDRIQQPRGNVFYDVGKRGARKLRIETPFLVAVVKGTQFNVAAREDASTIALFEGRLEIRSTTDNDVIDLVAGEIASRHRNEQDIGVIRMNATPSPAPPAATPGAEGGDQAAPAPRAAPPPADEGDEYLVREVDGPHEAVTDVALADARIELGATDTFTAALLNPGLPDLGLGEAPAPVVDAPVIGAPVLDTPMVDSGAGAAPGPAGDPLLPGGSPLPDVVESGTDSPDSVDPGAGVDAGAGIDTGNANAGAGGGASVDVGNDTVNVDLGGGVTVGDSDVGVDVDLGVDLNDDGKSNNGNAYGHDKDKANGEAKGHDKDDDTNLVEDVVNDVANLLDSARKPGKK